MSSQRTFAGRAREGYGGEGISGLKSLGTRDLGYKLTFLANKIEKPNDKVNLPIFFFLFFCKTFVEDDLTQIDFI